MGGVHIDGVPLHARDHLPDGPDPIDFPASAGAFMAEWYAATSTTNLGSVMTTLDWSNAGDPGNYDVAEPTFAISAGRNSPSEAPSVRALPIAASTTRVSWS